MLESREIKPKYYHPDGGYMIPVPDHPNNPFDKGYLDANGERCWSKKSESGRTKTGVEVQEGMEAYLNEQIEGLREQLEEGSIDNYQFEKLTATLWEEYHSAQYHYTHQGDSFDDHITQSKGSWIDKACDNDQAILHAEGQARAQRDLAKAKARDQMEKEYIIAGSGFKFGFKDFAISDTYGDIGKGANSSPEPRYWWERLFGSRDSRSCENNFRKKHIDGSPMESRKHFWDTHGVRLTLAWGNEESYTKRPFIFWDLKIGNQKKATKDINDPWFDYWRPSNDKYIWFRWAKPINGIDVTF